MQEQMLPQHLFQVVNEPVSTSEYQVRLARPEELRSIFKLRYDIFYTELGALDSVSHASGFDRDEYDELCDHLIATYKNEIVGTYRLLPMRRLMKLNLKPYSESEFSLEAIISEYGENILELGRSCVHQGYRTGVVPRLLWAGIAQYMLNNRIQALLGCVSVHGMSHVQAVQLREILFHKGHWHYQYNSAVKERFAIAMSEHSEEREPTTLLNSLMSLPPLMKGYFNLGAKIAGGPAYDASFQCHDFLVLLDRNQIKPKYYNSLVRPLLENNILNMNQ